jgi:hypothetical protein
MSFPNVDWGKVPGDIVNQLVKGFQKEFFSGNPTQGTPNVLTGVFKLLSSILGGGGLGGINDLINAAMGGLNPLAAAALPAVEAKTIAVSNDSASRSSSAPTAPATAYVETGGDATKGDDSQAAEDDEKAEPTKTSNRPVGTYSTKPTGAASTPKPTGPVGSVVGGVTNVVGGVTGGVTNIVGGVTGGVTNTVGGLTGGITNTVGGLTGGLTGAVSGALGGLGKP